MTQITEHDREKKDYTLRRYGLNSSDLNKKRHQKQVSCERDAVNEVKPHILVQVITPRLKHKEFIAQVRVGNADDIAEDKYDQIIQSLMKKIVEKDKYRISDKRVPDADDDKFNFFLMSLIDILHNPCFSETI
jgi:hypothetical protein